jgi:hypothetical protein
LGKKNPGGGGVKRSKHFARGKSGIFVRKSDRTGALDVTSIWSNVGLASAMTL